MFYSFTDSYADQPKYIAQEIIRRGLPYELVWVSLKKKVVAPAEIRTVCGRAKAWRELSTSQLIISNSRLGKYFKHGYAKKPGQFYIQTWHGSFGIKKMEGDAHELRNSYLEKAKLDSKHIDYLLSNSRWLSDVMRGCFFYDGPILETGSPRNDPLFAADKAARAEATRRALGLPEGVKTALYAPTFRAEGIERFERMDYQQVQEALQEKFGGKWCVITRLHPGHGGERLRWLTKGVVDASHYPDMTELLLLADLMVSDYSSCLFDYLLTGKPAFCYAPDRQEYELQRGLYYPLSDTPMPIAENNAQLIDAIHNFDAQRYADETIRFIRDKGSAEDGHAAERVADLIEKLLG